MKGAWKKREYRHLCIGYLPTGWVGMGVELALHRQPGLSRGRRNQFHHHRVTHQWLATPVLTDPGKEAMLDFIPFAGTRRQMTYRD